MNMPCYDFSPNLGKFYVFDAPERAPEPVCDVHVHLGELEEAADARGQAGPAAEAL